MQPVNFLLRLLRFIKRHIKAIYLKIKHTLNTTFSTGEWELIPIPIDVSLFSKIPSEVIDLYHQHFFDILGSGWTQVSFGKKYTGFEGNNYSDNTKIIRINRSNRTYSKKLNKKIDSNYNLIDWQVDIKSGYRWSESTHYKFIKFGHLPGVDVKLPWELARMHHLVHLAIDFSKSPNLANKRKNKKEFQNQVIDFIANNPPGFGVNWVCSMDVAIRIANILLAYDILKSCNCKFSAEFNAILANSIYDHGKHIIDNLEWYNGVRGNHYFSNIIGLIFCAGHLKITEITQAWFAFAVSELINEIEFQFYNDGGNFEGSTFYHRLVTELAIWGTVIALEKADDLFLNISSNRILKKIYLRNKRMENYSKINSSFIFPKQYFEKLKMMLCFLEDIKLYDGTIPQIGDNDSGRLFKPCPTYEKTTVKKAKANYLNLKNYNELKDENSYFKENHLKVDSLIENAYYMLSSKICSINSKIDSEDIKSEFDFLKSLFISKTSCKESIREKLEVKIDNISKEEIDTYLEHIIDDKSKKIIRQYFEINVSNFKNDLKLIKYEFFGVYIYKAKNIFLLIRAKNHKSIPKITGHFHQDQLSLEMHINRTPIIVDPGTYVYSSSPKKEKYTVQKMHIFRRYR